MYLSVAQQARMTMPVNVVISRDEKSGQLIVTPTDIILNSALKSEIQVKCLLDKDARIEIAFDAGDSPFRSSRLLLNGNSNVLSGVPSPEKARAKPYKCTVRLLNADAKSPASIPISCSVTID